MSGALEKREAAVVPLDNGPVLEMQVLLDALTFDEGELVADEDTVLALMSDSGVLADVEMVLGFVRGSVFEKVEVAPVATEDDSVLEPALHVLVEVLVEYNNDFETDGDFVLVHVLLAEMIVMITGEVTVVDATMIPVVEKDAVTALVADDSCVQLPMEVNGIVAVLLGRL